MHFASNPQDGVALAWEEHGNPEGEPLLLVHGSALSKAVWRGMGYLRALGPKYRLLTMDLRGHGRSGKPRQPEDYRMPLVMADVLAVLDAAGVASAHFLGYSFGARIGFSLGVTAPERMRSFISAGGSYRISTGSIGQLFFPEYDAALAQRGMAGFIDGWEHRLGHPVDPVTRMAFMANDPVALRAYFAQTERGEGVPEQRLAEFQIPSLLLAGSLDAQRLDDSRYAVSLMPHAELLELPGRDHADTLFPAGPVLAVIEPFLDSQ
ncbi:alpha/beta fold hydrolase [Psychromicrobium sp. YIM B11713]|uniref:alpha/beta fold hydrolase n=1 Tax=Psychromicrobium sp. YIM B11713 TaxID=3145233 RepID=UPI00374FB2AA